MSWVQTRGTEMMERYGFLGVPTATFETAGRSQFVALLSEGLCPESKVLDIGCGVLRTAYWLVRFLDPDGYCGIEPARERVEHGLSHLFPPELLAAKRPRFDFNAVFDSSPFSTSFDFFLAGSIWTHASKRQVELSLDSFVRDGSPRAVFLASVLLATNPEEEYVGDTWVGTSHESQTPGVIRHSFAWILGQCVRRGLTVTIAGDAFDGQRWLRVRRGS
jgi:hypothetical protein